MWPILIYFFENHKLLFSMCAKCLHILMNIKICQLLASSNYYFLKGIWNHIKLSSIITKNYFTPLPIFYYNRVYLTLSQNRREISEVSATFSAISIKLTRSYRQLSRHVIAALNRRPWHKMRKRAECDLQLSFDPSSKIFPIANIYHG